MTDDRECVSWCGDEYGKCAICQFRDAKQMIENVKATENMEDNEKLADEEVEEELMDFEEVRDDLGMPESHTTDTRGVRVLGDVAQYPRINVLVGDVNSHGEVHATFEGHDSDVEIRQGTATINCDKGVIRVTDGTEWRKFAIDSLVSWYKPHEVFH
jgi:hypothetical protein